MQNGNHMPEKRKNGEVLIPPGNSKKPKFGESQQDFKEGATSRVEPDVEDVEDEDEEDFDEDEEDFNEEEEGDSDEDEDEDSDGMGPSDGIDDCCREQFRRFTAGEEPEEEEDLEECCVETLEGLNRYGPQYFKMMQLRNLYGNDSDDEPFQPPPPKQKLLMEKPKCFEVLGIPDTSTEDEIKRAYLKLARKWHPDKNPNQSEEDAAKFKEILEAYEILMGLRVEEPQPGG